MISIYHVLPSFVNTFPMAIRSRPMRAPPLRGAPPISVPVGAGGMTEPAQWTFNKRPPHISTNMGFGVNINVPGHGQAGINLPPEANPTVNQPHNNSAFVQHLFEVIKNSEWIKNVY